MRVKRERENPYVLPSLTLPMKVAKRVESFLHLFWSDFLFCSFVTATQRALDGLFKEWRENWESRQQTHTCTSVRSRWVRGFGGFRLGFPQVSSGLPCVVCCVVWAGFVLFSLERSQWVTPTKRNCLYDSLKAEESPGELGISMQGLWFSLPCLMTQSLYRTNRVQFICIFFLSRFDLWSCVWSCWSSVHAIGWSL